MGIMVYSLLWVMAGFVSSTVSLVAEPRALTQLLTRHKFSDAESMQDESLIEDNSSDLARP